MAVIALQELLEACEEVVDLSDVDVDEQTVIGEGLDVDSREMLRMLSKLEGRYRIRFDPKKLLTIETVGDLLEMVRRLAARPA